MSDINSVAESMGIPADLVSRSAAARATASGTTTEDVLGAWGGGGSVASSPEPEPEADTTTDDRQEATVEETASPDPSPQSESSAPSATPPPAAPIVAAATSSEPPVLVGASDNPWAVVVGALGLFLIVLLIGLIGPSIPDEPPGARTGDITFSNEALAGQKIYESLGCAGCHTQMIRPLVADVGLGPVTLNDTNQVLGTRRFGPDLAEIGSRMSGPQMEAVAAGLGGHPGHSLSADDIDDLVAYLTESATGSGG